MNKEGYIKILQYGRKKYGIRRFEQVWVDSYVINKKERVSCCYAKFYQGARDSTGKIVEHCTSNEHILKLVARYGFESEYLNKEVRYYSGKILEGKE